ncbi:MAG TPA: SURF1 family protein [Acetobacteraceae bacterium]|nr:SURF1 family protein [Acetobacteraceae bacterium]
MNRLPVGGYRPPEKNIRSATFATFIALVMLIALGVWQIQRLHWKEGLLAQIAHAEQAPPVRLVGVPAPFAKVWTEGNLQPGVALYGAFVRTAPDGSAELGADRLQILQRPDSPPVLVDLGWVATEGATPPVAAGAARIVGYARPPSHPSWFSPEDEAATHRFFTLDPAPIARSLGVAVVAPFTLVALGEARPGSPVPASTLPRPPNNHLQYALTWFGLAGALAGVFAVWRSRVPRRV